MSALLHAFQQVVAGPALHLVKMHADDGTPKVRMTHDALSGLYSFPFQLSHRNELIPLQIHPDVKNILIPEATLHRHLHVAIFRIPFADSVSLPGERWVPVNEDLSDMLLQGRIDPSSYHIADRIVTRSGTVHGRNKKSTKLALLIREDHCHGGIYDSNDGNKFLGFSSGHVWIHSTQ
jgi:hypothetical protein